MDEYIVELSYDPVYDCIESQDIVKEKIVRCRDCKYCGMDETKYAGLGCVKFGFGSYHKDVPFGDGYCAWGDERDEQWWNE